MSGVDLLLSAIKVICFLAILPGNTHRLLALESDSDQDVLYSSDGGSVSRIDGDMRITTLDENVKIIQGSLEISGDSAIIRRNLEFGDIERFEIYGSPARYQQQADSSGELVEGESETINYFEEGEPIVEFLGNATLTRQNDILRCASIKYYTETGTIETTGPCEGITSSPND